MLVPAEFGYTTKMLEPAIWVPCPKAIHDLEVGPVIWKKMSPWPLLALVVGTLIL